MKYVLCALLPVLAIASFANANEITYTVAHSDNYSGDFNISEVLSVPQFDPSLGTLSSVTVDFSISAEGWLGFENKGNAGNKTIRTYTYYLPTTDPYYDTTHGDLTLTLGSQTLASINWSVAKSYAFAATVFDGTTDYAGTSGFKTQYLSDSRIGSFRSNVDLDQFIGTGSVNFDLAGTSWFVVVFPGGNGSSMSSSSGAGNVTVTYSYVPEPATMAILGLGGLILGIRRK